MNRRRLLSISTCALIFLFPLVGQAQRGGGARGMGGMGGGHISGGRVGPPARTVGAPIHSTIPSGRVVAARIGVSHARTGHVTSRSFRTVRSHGLTIIGGGFHHGHFAFHHRFFFNNCFGTFPCNPFFLNSAFGFPFLGFPYYDPFLADSYAPSQPEQQPVATEDNGADTQLAVEMQRLSDEVEQLREQRPPGPAITQIQPQGPISAHPPAASTTFVFHDGHRVVAENFAIVGNTLWILNQHTAKKVPLTDLDRAATEDANSSNGVDFRLP